MTQLLRETQKNGDTNKSKRTNRSGFRPRSASAVNKHMKEATEAGTQRNELSAVGSLRLQVVTDELDHVVEM